MRTSCLVVCGLLFLGEGSAETLKWDASSYSQEVTPCDLVATHGSDPNAAAPGASGSEMDFPRAIAACEAAVAVDSGNPRLRYQLARVYTYAGEPEKGKPHMDAAVAAEYPQALFVEGYMQYLGIQKRSGDSCKAAKLLRRSAQYGRLAAQIGYAGYALDGGFDECGEAVEPEEIRSFLASAAGATDNYYRSMLIGMLQEEVDATWPVTKGN